ncbi:hypothetical protein YTPLAS18_15970 [Nitrospira sp.]|nr:hypothetical protein YTPLAS18_15970 [Nitrospira sp.]
MPRSLWKGAISFGLVHIPVSLVSADRGGGFDFTMLDRRSMQPVGFRRVNKTSGKEVPWKDIVKGYEYEKGRYVIVTDEDFRNADVEATQTIDLQSFVPLDEISPFYFDTPYYITPQRGGQKGYRLLLATLARTGKVGIATVVIRTRQHTAAIWPHRQVLVLNTLRYHDQIRDTKTVAPDSEKASANVSPREIDMAAKLVQGMTAEWKPGEYRDTYHDSLMRVIRNRIKSGRTRQVSHTEKQAAPGKERGKVLDLMALLKRSVQEKGGSRHGRKSQKRSRRSKSHSPKRMPHLRSA